jgi:hypothetical protein
MPRQATRRLPTANDARQKENIMRIHVSSLLLLAAGIVFMPALSVAQFRASITIAPPALLVDEQPICPGDGYLWTPGYWAWDDAYYWVPGVWVMAPEAGYLWTPGYWGWGGDAFMFNEGYWGTSIGFYGGINYGFGYFGQGYEGGRWDNGHFFYNTTLNNVNVSVIHNVYNTRVSEASVSRVSYNGGNGGISVRATTQQEAAGRERHIAPVAAQTERAQAARNDPQQRNTANRSSAPAGAPRSSPAVHPSQLPAAERPAQPNTGNVKLDRQYQKQQDQLVAKQGQERQNLQKQQDKEHQQLAKQGANEAKSQQLEERHQNQTQQLQQGHAQQMQQMQQRQQPAGGGRGGGRR